MAERLDVTYASRDGGDISLDIYEPDREKGQRTAVLLFHGGGWRGGSKASMAVYARHLAADGFTAVAVQYRLLGVAPWPAQIEDVKAAIRWTREHAVELGIEPGQIVLQGFSAGGHLALVAAGTAAADPFAEEGAGATSSEVAAVVAFFPPAKFQVGETRERGTSPGTGLLGEGATSEALRLASPVTHITPGYPPTFLIHGTGDRVTPVSASMLLFEALKDAGSPADLHLYSGQNHEFQMIDSFREVVLPEVSLFIRRHVSEKERIDAQTLEQSMFARRAAEAAAKGASS